MKTKMILLMSFLSVILSGCGGNTTIDGGTTVDGSKNVDIHCFTDNTGIEYDGMKLFPKNIKETEELEALPLSMKIDNVVAGEYSKYIIIDVMVENETNNEIIISADEYPKITDSKGRSYSSLLSCVTFGCWVFVENLHKDLVIKPGIPESTAIIYEVAKDSEGLYYESTYDGEVHRVLLYNE